jgi:hypothetical protein
MPSKNTSGQISVVIVSNSKYSSGLQKTISSVSGKKICYVSLNKPYITIAETVKLNPKNVTFIDCVSGGVAKPKGYNVIFVSSPKALTDLSIDIVENMKKSEVIIFDALSTLLVYNDAATVIKFVHSIVSKIRTTKTKIIFMTLREDTNTDMMKDLSMFVDKVEKPE